MRAVAYLIACSSFYVIYLREETLMAGTVKGGRAAASTNKARYGKDFYAKIGAKGGKKGHTGGFYANRQLARTAGAIGGKKSRRVSRRAKLSA
jgi:general stress protein YciG